jgi:SWI/SNF-related matrix-associated actin-dependent regulator of chromatin subfamily A-like protein 1
MYYYREKDYWYFGALEKSVYKNIKLISSFKRNATNKEIYIKSDPAKDFLLKEFVSDNEIEEANPLSIVRPGCKAEIKPFKELLSRKDIELLIENLPLLKKPRSYQMDYLYYAVNHGNHINGSGVGCGKTKMAIFYAEMLDLFPCMVVCPASVKSGWLREWKETNPDRRVSVISTSSPPEDFEADVIVINYDILGKRVTKENGKTSLEIRLDGMKKKSFSLVIADEIHFLKNRKSIRSKSFKKLIHKVPSVIGLTGTLIMNRPAELLNILMLIERIKEIAPDDQYHHYFFERYCNMKETNFGMDISGASNIKELNRLLKECCYFQVSKRDALKELPPISENVVECEITNKRAYKKAKDDLLQFIEDKFKDEEKVEKAARAEFLVKLSTLKQLSLEGKEKFIKKWVEEWMEANEEEKLLVFASQSTILTKIAGEFKEGLLITGGTTTKKRDEILQKFFSQKESRVLFANIGCLGTGVDGLQKVCSNMAILELPPRPSDLVQVIGRLERSGQENPVTIQYLLSPETIDRDLWEMLKGKKDVTDMLNKGFQDDTSLMILQKYKNER